MNRRVILAFLIIESVLRCAFYYFLVAVRDKIWYNALEKNDKGGIQRL